MAQGIDGTELPKGTAQQRHVRQHGAGKVDMDTAGPEISQQEIDAGRQWAEWHHSLGPDHNMNVSVDDIDTESGRLPSRLFRAAYDQRMRELQGGQGKGKSLGPADSPDLTVEQIGHARRAGVEDAEYHHSTPPALHDETEGETLAFTQTDAPWYHPYLDQAYRQAYRRRRRELANPPQTQGKAQGIDGQQLPEPPGKRDMRERGISKVTMDTANLTPEDLQSGELTPDDVEANLQTARHYAASIAAAGEGPQYGGWRYGSGEPFDSTNHPPSRRHYRAVYNEEADRLQAEREKRTQGKGTSDAQKDAAKRTIDATRQYELEHGVDNLSIPYPQDFIDYHRSQSGQAVPHWADYAEEYNSQLSGRRAQGKARCLPSQEQTHAMLAGECSPEELERNRNQAANMGDHAAHDDYHRGDQQLYDDDIYDHDEMREIYRLHYNQRMQQLIQAGTQGKAQGLGGERLPPGTADSRYRARNEGLSKLEMDAEEHAGYQDGLQEGAEGVGMPYTQEQIDCGSSYSNPLPPHDDPVSRRGSQRQRQVMRGYNRGVQDSQGKKMEHPPVVTAMEVDLEQGRGSAADETNDARRITDSGVFDGRAPYADDPTESFVERFYFQERNRMHADKQNEGKTMQRRVVGKDMGPVQQPQMKDPNRQAPPMMEPQPGQQLMDLNAEASQQEPYGTRLLRRVHEDQCHLLQDYDGLLEMCENESVKALITKLLQNKAQTLDAIESTFAKQYAHLPPLEGTQEVEEGQVSQGRAPVMSKQPQGPPQRDPNRQMPPHMDPPQGSPMPRKDMGVPGNPGMQESTPDRESEEPSGEEAFEATVRRQKALPRGSQQFDPLGAPTPLDIRMPPEGSSRPPSLVRPGSGPSPSKPPGGVGARKAMTKKPQGKDCGMPKSQGCEDPSKGPLAVIAGEGAPQPKALHKRPPERKLGVYDDDEDDYAKAFVKDAKGQLKAMCAPDYEHDDDGRKKSYHYHKVLESLATRNPRQTPKTKMLGSQAVAGGSVRWLTHGIGMMQDHMGKVRLVDRSGSELYGPFDTPEQAVSYVRTFSRGGMTGSGVGQGKARTRGSSRADTTISGGEAPPEAAPVTRSDRQKIYGRFPFRGRSRADTTESGGAAPPEAAPVTGDAGAQSPGPITPHDYRIARRDLEKYGVKIPEGFGLPGAGAAAMASTSKKALTEASAFFKRLSEEKAFGDAHREQSLSHFKALGGQLEGDQIDPDEELRNEQGMMQEGQPDLPPDPNVPLTDEQLMELIAMELQQGGQGDPGMSMGQEQFPGTVMEEPCPPGMEAECGMPPGAMIGPTPMKGDPMMPGEEPFSPGEMDDKGGDSIQGEAGGGRSTGKGSSGIPVRKGPGEQHPSKEEQMAVWQRSGGGMVYDYNRGEYVPTQAYGDEGEVLENPEIVEEDPRRRSQGKASQDWARTGGNTSEDLEWEPNMVDKMAQRHADNWAQGQNYDQDLDEYLDLTTENQGRYFNYRRMHDQARDLRRSGAPHILQDGSEGDPRVQGKANVQAPAPPPPPNDPRRRQQINQTRPKPGPTGRPQPPMKSQQGKAHCGTEAIPQRDGVSRANYDYLNSIARSQVNAHTAMNGAPMDDATLQDHAQMALAGDRARNAYVRAYRRHRDDPGLGGSNAKAQGMGGEQLPEPPMDRDMRETGVNKLDMDRADEYANEWLQEEGVRGAAAQSARVRSRANYRPSMAAAHEARAAQAAREGRGYDPQSRQQYRKDMEAQATEEQYYKHLEDLNVAQTKELARLVKMLDGLAEAQENQSRLYDPELNMAKSLGSVAW